MFKELVETGHMERIERDVQEEYEMSLVVQADALIYPYPPSDVQPGSTDLLLHTHTATQMT